MLKLDFFKSLYFIHVNSNWITIFSYGRGLSCQRWLIRLNGNLLVKSCYQTILYTMKCHICLCIIFFLRISTLSIYLSNTLLLFGTDEQCYMQNKHGREVLDCTWRKPVSPIDEDFMASWEPKKNVLKQQRHKLINFFSGFSHHLTSPEWFWI